MTAQYGARGGDTPIIIGETGGTYEGKDKQWQDALIDYAAERGMGATALGCTRAHGRTRRDGRASGGDALGSRI